MLSLGSDIRDRCVRELSRACEIYGLLPSSYRVKSTLKKSENPIATGGFFDIWKATNEGKEEFAVKAFRVYQSVSMQVKKVRQNGIRILGPPSKQYIPWIAPFKTTEILRTGG